MKSMRAGEAAHPEIGKVTGPRPSFNTHLPRQKAGLRQHGLDEPPSFYIRRQIHATFQDDQVGMQILNLTGARLFHFDPEVLLTPA
jgi:hypothetical protein